MPIEVQCGNCGKRLRVPDAFIGRQAKCPSCQAAVALLPSPSGAAAAAAAEARKSSPSHSAAATKEDEEAGQWYVLTGEQERFGPVRKADLDSWIGEGRLDAQCQVLMEGWEEWKWAEEVYPELAEQPKPAPAAEPAGDAHQNLLPEISQSMAALQSWLSVLMALGAVACILVLVIGGITLSRSPVGGVLQLVVAVLYGPVLYLLFVYWQRSREFVRYGTPESLISSLTAQRRLFQGTAISALAGLLLWIVLILLIEGII